MNSRIKIILLAVLSGLVVLVSSVSAEGIKAGEKIHYNVLQMGMKLGEATLTFKGEESYEGRPAVLIVFLAKGFNFFDEEKIYVDPVTYKPFLVERDLNIFGSKEKIREVYAPGQVKIIKTSASGTQSEQTIDKDGLMDNIYAFIYAYRQTGLFSMQDRFKINLPTKDVVIRMVRQVPLSAAGQRYNAYYMESDPAKYKLWFDSSKDKLPLRISGAIGVANTSMVMTKYEK